ncbi:unnamed protein product [Linum tenue]|uniref:Dof zinc finger protein n=1 Tax=Linum tenue TaxID=586396 RepID=A0AAV0JFZ3_9ROSI|nr:unnamed protein product [Linum tenue]
MDTAQWPQEIVVKPLEEIVVGATPQKPGGGLTPTSSEGGGGGGGSLERKARPQKEQALNCPRCNSTNTKFCYYNNYSLTQPRYFCKTCRRYWTEGGSLRNIPVGGGSRKNKRPSSSLSPSPANTSSKKLPGLISTPAAALTPNSSAGNGIATTAGSQNPNVSNKMIHQEGQDLNLAFPRSFTELIHQNGNHHHHDGENKSQISAMELLTGISPARGGILNNPSFMHMPPPPQSSLVHHHHQAAADHGGGGYNTSGLSFPVLQHQDFKPNGLSFSLDGIGLGISSDNNESGDGYHHHNHEGGGGGGGRPMFSFEDLKQVPSSNTTTNDSNGEMVSNGDGKDQHADSSGYWTGMLGGGSW